MSMTVRSILTKSFALILAAAMIVCLIPAVSARADEGNEITFYTEEEFTGKTEVVDLDTVKAGDPLPAFASQYKNWEIRLDGTMDLVYATRPGQAWTQEMIDSLKALKEAGLELNGLPAVFNISEPGLLWNAKSPQAIANMAGLYSCNIIYFVYGTDVGNASYDIAEIDIRSIRAGDPLPTTKNGRNIWRFQTADGEVVAKTKETTWSQGLLDYVLNAISEGKGVVALDAASSKEFSDVIDPTQSNYKPIYWAVENGIVSGYKNGQFGPQDDCTRGQFAVMLWRINKKPEVALTGSFNDVTESMSSCRAIEWAAASGIVQGYKDGTFRPTNQLTRRQIVVMLWRYMGRPSASKAATFSDVEASDSASKAIAWASEAGIVKGYSDGTFKPDNNCTRSQIVTILYRAVREGFITLEE